MSELKLGAIALALITLLIAGGLCFCFCKTQQQEPSNMGEVRGEKSKSCFNFGFGGGSGGGDRPKFTPMRGARKSSSSKMSQDERAIELARFERMSNRSDAYPKYGQGGTSNPISAPPGSGDKFKSLRNGDMVLV
jgi:hypothetical protein